MSNIGHSLLRPCAVALILFVCALLYYGHAAINFPTLFNIDNHLNIAASRYIAENHKLPVVSADNKEILFTEIGTTRSLRPPFTFIVSAVVSNLLQGVIDSEGDRLRLGSSLLGALIIVVAFAGFYIAFNHIGIALFGSLALGLLPKFVFLASCNNDDIGAIFSLSLLFTSVVAIVKHRQSTGALFALAFAFGLVFQTKYTAWLALPWLGLYCLILLQPIWPKLFKWVLPLLLVVVLAGGWWLLFNIINYGVDDPSAMRRATELQTTLSDNIPNQQGYLSEGISLGQLLTNHDQFLSKSFKSFIGYLDWLDLEMSRPTYLFYACIFVIGLLGIAFRSREHFKKSAYLEPLILLIVVSQCVFYIHHNLVRDIQPQSRYILPVLMPMIYLFLSVLSSMPNELVKLKIGSRDFKFQTVLCSVLSVFFIAIYWHNLTSNIVPSFSAKPYYTKLGPPMQYDLSQAFKVVSAKALRYEFVHNSLVLTRTHSGSAELVLHESFCQILPLNSLISMDVSSSSRGGFHLRLDRDNLGRFENITSGIFPAGESEVLLSVDSRACSGAKITLSKDTQALSFSGLQIREIKIHAYGRPI